LNQSLAKSVVLPGNWLKKKRVRDGKNNIASPNPGSN